MGRRRGPGRGHAAGSRTHPPGADPEQRRLARWGVAIVAAFAALVVVAVLLRPILPRAGREIATAPQVVPDTVTAYRALVEGSDLSNRGLSVASLPRLSTAVAGLPETWEARFNLASALENAALESGMRLGRMDPVTRSSVERVRLVAHACREREVALGLAGDPRRRAWTRYVGAKVWLTWGMPVDALALARQAQALDPGWDAPAQLATRIEADLAGGGSER